MISVPILTYHSQNIRGNDYSNNDHVALASDLRALHQAGLRIVALSLLLDGLDGRIPAAGLDRAVVLSFDDGCDFDVRDLDYPGHGVQRSFTRIFQDFRDDLGPAAQPGLHATSFVIASREARRVIDAGSLFGRGWISDDWWAEADRSGLIAVENHGWDHNHPDLAGERRGGFHIVDTEEQCFGQVVRAAGAIAAHTGRWPRYFAYPFGESSTYIREVFFPERPDAHRCRAALGTEPGHVTPASDRWNLPRYVCSRDWTSTESLLALLRLC
jgi:peptidoglycan/xylan/chitin deacetylase (PgdA/CDA1 family)